MTPIQQLYLGLGASKKTYMDDVFSTYLHVGTGSAKTINNGIDLAGEGGMTWIKDRDAVNEPVIFDTERGTTKYILPSHANAEATQSSNSLTSFNSNGFTLGGWSNVNENTGNSFASWTFRKAKGFFDVVTWTGNDTAGRQIAHNLGSVPGVILVKSTSFAKYWVVYHRESNASPEDYALALNDTGAAYSTPHWNNTAPTATHFTVGSYNNNNGSGETYVAYLFAGGESTAATARSVDFHGTNNASDSLSLAASSDLQLGTGDFTIEGWAKHQNDYGFGNNPCLFDLRSATGSTSDGFAVFIKSSGHAVGIYSGGSYIIEDGIKLFVGQWYHFAIVKNSGTITLYINGTKSGSYTSSTNFTNNTLRIGSGAGGANAMDGEISNFRIVKGTALYTSSFKPPTEPLTNITNTTLLCCNDSSTTGKTVGPTITANNSPTASTDSPFDDPAAFTFGENGDQGIIKCGSYVGNGSSTGPEINLGWEPQYILFKNTGASEHWSMFDSMRGLVTGGEDEHLKASSTDAESGNTNWMSLTPTGFKINTTGGEVNNNGDTIIYMAIRRSDGYVGKPADAGTGVFAMDAGNSNANQAFTSGFPVDFALYRKPASAENWRVGARLLGRNYLEANNSAVQGDSSWQTWDDNTGFAENTYYDSTFQSWMFKRHAGFDVVTYTANNSQGHVIAHSLGRIPEMIWFKNRDTAWNWNVYHKGLNGGTDPQKRHLRLNMNSSEVNLEDHSMTTADFMNDKMPTATHFELGDGANPNSGTGKNIALLFASVDGISKVGSYDGSASDQTITTGFQPRFVIIKCTTDADDWCIWDTTRGWASGNDSRLVLNTDSAASTNVDVGNPTSTGFVVGGSQNTWNNSGRKYIYYAHA